ncbi:pectate lyase [uncultured Draconibacterium sp.]|uniref:pectate lyase family protein n=1 Tax=uncultured Draconibacterium sp. TaxID=1573823 RepID=UPI0025ED70F0|nr:pectate lyase [uncultured Draconibacterium sp.]
MKVQLSLILILLFQTVLGQQIAFPGAEGGGKYTTGGRGGKVIFVDNLNNKGNGSFRKAIEAEGPRTIIFRVSGTIELEKTIHIKNGDLTIAGQTAPGDGICLKNYGVRVDADNVIIRYLRVRPGDKSHEEMDAITGMRNKNIIIDHCSFSWADDEVASFYDNENFTLQWCIISESFNLSFHHKGAHGYGGIWGGSNASFHHNLISDHVSRNPRLQGSRYTNDPDFEKADFRNNVIYNWGNNSVYGGEEGHYNLVNNYYKPGPATKKDVRDRILNLTQDFYNESRNTDTLRAGWFYLDGNVIEGNKEISKDNWAGGVQVKNLSQEMIDRSRLTSPVEHTAIKTDKAEEAYKKVLQDAGASYQRDAVDKRIIHEATTGKETVGKQFRDGGKGIIDSQTDVGGWPILRSTPPPPDADNDGMPDKWEKQNGLNPEKADNNDYKLDKKYTNIEVYLNSIIAQKK